MCSSLYVHRISPRVHNLLTVCRMIRRHLVQSFDTFGMVCGEQDSQVRNIENEINELFEWVQNVIDEQP
jgi:hypothetical protein